MAFTGQTRLRPVTLRRGRAAKHLRSDDLVPLQQEVLKC
jgi:hypothetical protein